jgi:hypothetical protein
MDTDTSKPIIIDIIQYNLRSVCVHRLKQLIYYHTLSKLGNETYKIDPITYNHTTHEIKSRININQNSRTGKKEWNKRVRKRERVYHIEIPFLIVVELRINDRFEVLNREDRVGH